MTGLHVVDVGSALVPGAILAIAGLSKLVNYGWFVRAVGGYGIVPAVLTSAVAALIIAIEIGTGACLVLGVLHPWPAYVAAILFGVFGTALARTLWRRVQVRECGCVKTATDKAPSLSAIVRVGCLAGLVLISASRPALVSDIAVVLFALLVVGLAVTIVWDAAIARRSGSALQPSVR